MLKYQQTTRDAAKPRKYQRTSCAAHQPSPQQSTSNLPVLVAGCAMREIVSRLESGSTEPSVIVVVAPEYDAAMIYEVAASALLECSGLLAPIGRFDVAMLPDTSRSVAQFFHDIDSSHSMFFIAARASDVTTDVELMADAVEILPPPSPGDFLAAAKVIGLRDMTDETAAFLAEQSLARVKLASRSGRPLAQIVKSLRNAAPPTKSAEDRTDGRTLREMKGYGEAQSWGLQLAKDLALWKEGEIGWGDVDRGVLLEGPPGCGKTTFAQALANTCEVALVCASYARWQACGHLGDFLKAMRNSFDQAMKKRPCVLFVDEFDSFGTRQKRYDTDNAEYQRQAVNGLLERLDPLGGREGVVVVGATNDAASIDPALLRPGRLEKIIKIRMPDAESRIAILRSYLGENCQLGPLLGIAEATEGWSGAQLEKLARDARRQARNDRRPVTDADVIEALPARVMLSAEKLKRLAVHESGHAIVGSILGKALEHVYIKDHLFEGQDGPIGEAVFRNERRLLERSEDYANSIAMMLGGIAAERLIFGDHGSGGGGRPESDLVRATDIATVMERYFGYGDTWTSDLGTGGRPLEWLRFSDPDLRTKVESRLQSEMARASRILTENRPALEALVGKLKMSYVVPGAVVEEIIKCGGAPPPKGGRRRGSCSSSSRVPPQAMNGPTGRRQTAAQKPTRGGGGEQ